MADRVNARLERMLPELEEFEKWGLFTRVEIKEIVRRRRQFEYQLHRQSRVKDDFLRYVDYEKQLESLRCIRKKAVLVDLEAQGKQWRGYLCDGAGVSRIIGIYRRAVTKFTSDLGLWFQYLEFCRVHSPKHMRRVLAKAVQQHPHVPGLWMYAASWDLECNLNMTAARALMQQGIRMCPHSEDLWLEYFRMELTYAQKLKARKLVLGISNEEKSGLDPESELSVKLARVIFRNAVAAVPSSLRFRQRFVEALDQFNLVSSSIIEDEISAGMRKDFAASEECWDWAAKRSFQRSQGSWESAVQVYEDALRAASTSRMFELYTSFLETLLHREEFSTAEKKSIVKALLRVLKRGGKACSSINLAEAHVQLLSRTGKLEKARKLATRLCDDSFKASGRIWALRLSLELEIASLEIEEIVAVFLKALKLVEISEASNLWLMALEYFSGRKSYLDMLFQLLETKLGGKNGAQTAADVACSAVDCVLHFNGVEKARHLYDKLLVLPRPSLQIFKHCIALERGRSALGDQEALNRVRRLFDAAIEIYGRENSELWLEYCQQERKAGSADAASSVYYRAKKTLQDPSIFIQKHQLLAA